MSEAMAGEASDAWATDASGVVEETLAAAEPAEPLAPVEVEPAAEHSPLPQSQASPWSEAEYMPNSGDEGGVHGDELAIEQPAAVDMQVEDEPELLSPPPPITMDASQPLSPVANGGGTERRRH